MAPAADGANDIIASLFTEHALDLLRFDAGQRREIRAFLDDLEASLVEKVARIDPTGPGRESYRAKRLERLLQQVRDTIRASYRDTSIHLRGELAELADIESEFAVGAINRGLGIKMAENVLSRSQVRALVSDVLVQGAPVKDWWARQAGDTLERFTDAMRLGVAEGESNGKLIRRIRGENGFMNITRRHAESLVRSATQAVAAEARDQTYKANRNVIKAVIWMATLDTRTTIGCAARDNRRYDVESKRPIGHNLPWEGGPGNRHWGCRSTSAPVTKSWRELGFDIDDLPPATRAAMDGKAPQDTTFEAWLAKQSRERQEAVLGPGRAELWRKGGLSFRDLIDGNGRELGVEELRAKVRA